MGNFVKLHSRKDLISFIEDVRIDFDCMEDWENFFGFRLECDDDGNELETVSEYAKHNSFNVEPCTDEYPIIAYYTFTKENDRFGGFGIEIFDYISVSKLAVKGLR